METTNNFFKRNKEILATPNFRLCLSTKKIFEEDVETKNEVIYFRQENPYRKIMPALLANVSFIRDNEKQHFEQWAENQLGEYRTKKMSGNKKLIDLNLPIILSNTRNKELQVFCVAKSGAKNHKTHPIFTINESNEVVKMLSALEKDFIGDCNLLSLEIDAETKKTSNYKILIPLEQFQITKYNPKVKPGLLLVE